MARKPTGNARGRYTDPANENVPCQYGCGKTGRKGPMVAHERHYCPKRPGVTERDAREGTASAPPAAKPERVAPALKPSVAPPPAHAINVTRQRVELRPWASPQVA